MINSCWSHHLLRNIPVGSKANEWTPLTSLCFFTANQCQASAFNPALSALLYALLKHNPCSIARESLATFTFKVFFFFFLNLPSIHFRVGKRYNGIFTPFSEGSWGHCLYTPVPFLKNNEYSEMVLVGPTQNKNCNLLTVPSVHLKIYKFKN